MSSPALGANARVGRAHRTLSLAALSLVAGGCAPQRANPYDARRCEPRCIVGQRCFEGRCIAPNDFVINANWTGDQQLTGGAAGRQISCDIPGHSVVVFADGSTPPGARHVAARLFDRSGAPLVNRITDQDGDLPPFPDATARYEQPAVAATRRVAPADQGGTDTGHDGFVVVAVRCARSGQDTCGGAPSRIVLRGFGRDGKPYETAERAIDRGRASAAVSPDVAAIDGARFIAVWAERAASGGGLEITALLVDDRGDAVGGAKPVVAGSTSGSDVQLAVGATQGDPVTVAIVWRDGSEIRGRTYDGELAHAGSTFTIDDPRSGRVTGFDVDGGSERLLVVWSRDGGCPGGQKRYCVRLASVDSRGRSTAVPLQLAAGDARLEMPALGVRDDDEAFVAWESAADGEPEGGIRGRFLASGKLVGDAPLRVNTTTNGRQYQPSVASCQGRFAVVFSDRSEASPDRHGTAVRGRRLVPPPKSLATGVLTGSRRTCGHRDLRVRPERRVRLRIRMRLRTRSRLRVRLRL